MQAMHWCKKNSKGPSGDIAFASFANLPITSFLDNPPEVSVEQFAHKMGEQAAQMLLKLLNGPAGAPVESKGDSPPAAPSGRGRGCHDGRAWRSCFWR